MRSRQTWKKKKTNTKSSDTPLTIYVFRADFGAPTGWDHTITYVSLYPFGNQISEGDAEQFLRNKRVETLTLHNLKYSSSTFKGFSFEYSQKICVNPFRFLIKEILSNKFLYISFQWRGRWLWDHRMRLPSLSGQSLSQRSRLRWAEGWRWCSKQHNNSQGGAFRRQRRRQWLRYWRQQQWQTAGSMAVQVSDRIYGRPVWGFGVRQQSVSVWSNLCAVSGQRLSVFVSVWEAWTLLRAQWVYICVYRHSNTYMLCVAYVGNGAVDRVG